MSLSTAIKTIQAIMRGNDPDFPRFNLGQNKDTVRFGDEIRPRRTFGSQRSVMCDRSHLLCRLIDSASFQYATSDSNARPLAPEANALSS